MPNLHGLFLTGSQVTDMGLAYLGDLRDDHRLTNLPITDDGGVSSSVASNWK